MPFQLEWKENIMRTESWQLALDHLAKEKKNLERRTEYQSSCLASGTASMDNQNTNRGMENEKPWTAEAGRRPVGGQNWPRNDHLERRRARA